MTTHAYAETYVDGAMNALGDMFDCAVNECGYAADDFFATFAQSDVARRFEHGNPKYVAGLSGAELAAAIVDKPVMPQAVSADKTPEYWAGWALAYYQWYANSPFATLSKNGLTLTKMLELYPTLHEADLSKFVSVADSLVGTR